MKKLFAFITALFIFSVPQAQAQTGAWVASWDMRSGLNEANEFKDFSRIILFAASFDSQDRVFLPETLDDYIADEYPGPGRPKGREIYLSVVNDRFDERGGATLKDSELISRLMASPQSRAAHKADLLSLLRRGDFSGLELDYEKVAAKDWPQFLAFAAELAAELTAQGKKLRVVLEPKEACLKSALPSGPEYSLMAYNLYGGHSGPGPKADPAFLKKLANWCAHLSPKPRLALATGGFAWEQDEVFSLTEIQARARAAVLGASAERDANSAYLKFRAEDGTSEARSLVEFVRGVYTEVWYADGQTLAALAAEARALGFAGIDLWRLGGNRPDSLKMLLEAAQ